MLYYMYLQSWGWREKRKKEKETYRRYVGMAGNTFSFRARVGHEYLTPRSET